MGDLFESVLEIGEQSVQQGHGDGIRFGHNICAHELFGTRESCHSHHAFMRSFADLQIILAYRDGMVAGIMDGRELGLQKGYEIGLMMLWAVSGD